MAKRNNSVAEQPDPLAQMMQQLATSSQPPPPLPVAVTAAKEASTEDPPADESTQRHRPAAVLVEIPITEELPPSEFTVHIEMKLTPPQSTTARRIAAQLDRKLVCLRNGQRVTTPSAAIKWMLEQVEKELS
jgi:hypothetical protein